MVYSPSDYDAGNPYPLVILLHGFNTPGFVQNAYLQTSNSVDEKQFVFLLPEGLTNPNGAQFWNGTPACCDGFGSGVDDVGYLRGLIAEASEQYNIDARRVYVMGHSNGGFMSYRMACEASDVVTAIASLAGATFATEAECTPDEPVSVLQIHGTDDSTILYDGGANGGGRYPSALDSVRRHAQVAGCNLDAPSLLPGLDILLADGNDTEALRFEDGCANGIEAELWTLPGAPHIPGVSPDFSPAILDWLFRQSK